MAGVRALRSKLNEEFLTCQICLNLYKDPVLLECQHSFCKACVGQCVHNNSTNLHCPICRQKTCLPKKLGLAVLKKNFFLQSLIDALNERRPSQLSIMSFDDVGHGGNPDLTSTRNGWKNGKMRKQQCDNCDDNKGRAISRCLDCTDFLCIDCEAVHCQTKFTKKHKVIRLKELRSGDYSLEIQARAKVFCPNHVEEICRTICEDCFAVACHTCLKTEHKDHKMKDLKDAVAIEKERALQFLERSSREEDRVKSRMEDLRRAKEEIGEKRRKVLEEIGRRTKALIAAAKSYEDKLSKEIKNVSKTHKSMLSRAEEDTNAKISQIIKKRQNLKEASDDVIVSGTPMDILELKSLTDELEEITRTYEESEETMFQTDVTEWSFTPSSGLSPSSFLDSIKSTLKNVIGNIEYLAGTNINAHTTDEDDDVITFTCGNNTSLNAELTSPTRQNADVNGYCHMRSLLPLRHVTSSNDFTSEDDDVSNGKPIFNKMNPVPRRKRENMAQNVETITSPCAESPSLTLMRKFPPILPGSKKNDVTNARVSTSRPHSTNRTSKSDAANSKNTVIQWRTNRSKSADRVLDDNNTSSQESAIRPKSECASATVQPITGRGRNRRRSSPGASRLSTSLASRVMTSPSGSANSLLSLSTSPVAALAENPALLGIYETPDPTSDAAVASLANMIASAPSVDDLDRIPGEYPNQEPTTTTSVPHSDTENNNILIRTFQANGKVMTFMSAPKLALTASGQILATDYKAQRVFTFSSSGSYVSSIKTKASGAKSLHPISVASDKKNKLLVACGEGIYKFNQSGKMTKKFGSGYFSKGCGIAVDSRNGKIVVTDIDKRCVSVHAPDGGLERIFRGTSRSVSESAGSNPNVDLRLQTPYFVTIDPRNGNIIVSDWASSDVKVFDEHGLCLVSINHCSRPITNPFSPPPSDVFCNPAGVACDIDGNLFIADHGRHRVAMFNNNWEFERFVATENDGLQNPWSIVVASNRHLYISEYWSRTIKEFTY